MKNCSGHQNQLSPPIIVLGMHNSGTSLVVRLLSAAGVHMVQDIEHNESNFVTNILNDQLLMAKDWAKSPILTLSEVKELKPHFTQFLDREFGHFATNAVPESAIHWGFKDPRICVLLPLYIDYFDQSRFVHIVRDAEHVANSLSKKSKRGVGLRDPSFWKSLHAQHLERVHMFAEELNKQQRYFELQYEDLCLKPNETLSALLVFLGLPDRADLTEVFTEEIYTVRI